MSISITFTVTNMILPNYHVFCDFTHSMFYIITLISLVFTQLMSIFNMFTQMLDLKCFVISFIGPCNVRSVQIIIMFFCFMW